MSRAYSTPVERAYLLIENANSTPVERTRVLTPTERVCIWIEHM